MTEISATQQRKINYQSDFDFLLRLTDSEGTNTGFPSYDWRLELFSSSGYGHKFTVSSVGGVLTNCFDDNGTIHVVCDNHKLGVGELCGKFYADIPNSIYADGIQLTVTPFSLGIILTTGASDDIVGIEVDNTVPMVYISAYELAVRQGFVGTEAEFYAALTRLPNLVGENDAKLAELERAVADAQQNAQQAIDEASEQAKDVIGQAQQALEETRQGVSNAIAEATAAVISSTATLRLDRETGRILLTIND